MFDLGAEWWSIVARTAIVYLALLGGLRLAGTRELGQMTPFDLVVILLIANALQNAMVGPDTSVTGGLIAAAVLLGMNTMLSRFRRRLPWLRHIAEGDPVLLVSDGKVLESRLRRLGLEAADLEQAAREHGIAEISDVRQAVLEVDGTISIVPSSSDVIRTTKKMRQRRRQN